MQAVVEGTAARRVRGARELVGLPVRPGGGRPVGRRQVGAAVHGGQCQANGNRQRRHTAN